MLVFLTPLRLWVLYAISFTELSFSEVGTPYIYVGYCICWLKLLQCVKCQFLSVFKEDELSLVIHWKFTSTVYIKSFFEISVFHILQTKTQGFAVLRFFRQFIKPKSMLQLVHLAKWSMKEVEPRTKIWLYFFPEFARTWLTLNFCLNVGSLIREMEIRRQTLDKTERQTIDVLGSLNDSTTLRGDPKSG